MSGERKRPGDWVYVEALKVGDEFMWAGHVAKLVDYKPSAYRGTTRVGIKLIVEAAGQTHELNYFMDETVLIATTPRVSEGSGNT